MYDVLEYWIHNNLCENPLNLKDIAFHVLMHQDEVHRCKTVTHFNYNSSGYS